MTIGDLLVRIGNNPVAPMTTAELTKLLLSTRTFTQQSTFVFTTEEEYEEQRMQEIAESRQQATAQRRATRAASIEQLALQHFGFYAHKGAGNSRVVVTVVDEEHPYVITHRVAVGHILYTVDDINAADLTQADLHRTFSIPGPLYPNLRLLSLEQYNELKKFVPIPQVTNILNSGD